MTREDRRDSTSPVHSVSTAIASTALANDVAAPTNASCESLIPPVHSLPTTYHHPPARHPLATHHSELSPLDTSSRPPTGLRLAPRAPSLEMEGAPPEWDDADNQLQDPEELKVLFTALDSYASVAISPHPPVNPTTSLSTLVSIVPGAPPPSLSHF